jgi:RNA polymerase sigma factor (sigma-70 family)
MTKEPPCDQVVRDLGPSLFKYFQGRAGQIAADDLTQECLLRLFRKCRGGEWNESLGSLRMFAYGIARNVALEFQRIPVFSEQGLDQVLEPHSMEEAMDEKWAQRRLRLAIQELAPIQQECIFLMMDEELSMEQIAGVVGVPVNTVKSHIHRAKLSLKEKLSPEVEDA